MSVTPPVLRPPAPRRPKAAGPPSAGTPAGAGGPADPGACGRSGPRRRRYGLLSWPLSWRPRTDRGTAALVAAVVAMLAQIPL
ncbi:MAG: hypothetical protein HOV87_33075, partial [Catenulispora sp.]|nr:hypothetical protein [Catenulispora sp.]